MERLQEPCWWEMCSGEQEKECKSSSLENDRVFLKWVTQKLAPVLLGAKSAELLCFRHTDEEKRNNLKIVTALLDQGSKVGYRSFETINGRFKILFYHKSSVDRIIRDKRNQRFLSQHGYLTNGDTEALLDQFIDRLMNHDIPHEIGLLLGYPLKDVMGFIGHPSLKLTKVEGWRVYGNPKLSDECHEKIKEARKEVLLKMKQMDPCGVIRAVC